MANSSLTARVRAIKLLEFKYNRLFKAAEGTPIQFNVEIKHRIPANSTRLEILVGITYKEKEANYPEPLLTAECLTIYQLDGAEAATEVDEESGKETVAIPEELMTQLFGESIAHSRALVAAQTAGTTFGGTHVEVRTNFPIENKVALQDNSSIRPIDWRDTPRVTISFKDNLIQSTKADEQEVLESYEDLKKMLAIAS